MRKHIIDRFFFLFFIFKVTVAHYVNVKKDVNIILAERYCVTRTCVRIFLSHSQFLFEIAFLNNEEGIDPIMAYVSSLMFNS